MSDRYDAIVIGTGQAGPALAVRLAKAGRKTAIIERKRFGGTCVNNGCIPTKTLIASARAAHVARTAGGWGVVVPPGMRVDMAAVKARKDDVVRASREGVTKWLRDTPGVTVIEGHARFEGAHARARRRYAARSTADLRQRRRPCIRAADRPASAMSRISTTSR